MTAKAETFKRRNNKVLRLNSGTKPHYTTAISGHQNSPLRLMAGWGLLFLAVSVALTGAYLWGRSQGSTDAVEILLPTPAPVLVQVVGEVNRPGVLTLEEGDRVIDAITAAGGVTDAAAPLQLNLAAFVRDGSRLVVPSLLSDSADESGASGVVLASAVSVGQELGNREPAPSSSLVDINAATKEELMSLPGIGEVRAERILARRQELGGFVILEQLLDVEGIGPGIFEKMRELVEVR